MSPSQALPLQAEGCSAVSLVRRGSPYYLAGVTKKLWSASSLSWRMMPVWFFFVYFFCIFSAVALSLEYNFICLLYDKITWVWDMKWKLTLLYSCFQKWSSAGQRQAAEYPAVLSLKELLGEHSFTHVLKFFTHSTSAYVWPSLGFPWNPPQCMADTIEIIAGTAWNFWRCKLQSMK